MGCCECKYDSSKLNSPHAFEEKTFTFKSDSFEDVKIASRNSPSISNENSKDPNNRKDKTRSTSYSPYGKNLELESAYMQTDPIFSHRNKTPRFGEDSGSNVEKTLESQETFHGSEENRPKGVKEIVKFLDDFFANQNKQLLETKTPEVQLFERPVLPARKPRTPPDFEF